jgi:Flp pilus assembly protein TadB
MASRRRPSKSSGPLDERQRKLLEEQEKLKERVEQLNRVIAEAPRIKAERARAQREELLVDRSTRAHHRLNSTTLADNRFEQLPGTSSSRAGRGTLKAERRQTRLIFFGLLVLLAILVVWLLSVWHWQWGGAIGS